MWNEAERAPRERHHPADAGTLANGSRWRAPAAPITYRPPEPARRMPPAPLRTVVAVLAPDERLRFDQAGAGTFAAVHRDALPQIVRALREAPPDAALAISTAALARLGPADAARLGALARAFPTVAPVLLLTDGGDRTAGTGVAAALLALGRHGVERVVDLRGMPRWGALREELGAAQGQEVAALAGELVDAGTLPAGVGRFLVALLSLPVQVATVQAFAARLGLRATTLTSRFRRAGMPSPRVYLAYARLVRAARLLEAPGRSLSATALALDYSSPQSFGRHVRALLGLRALEFRRRFDGRAMLARMCEDLITPHLAVLARMDGGRATMARAECAPGARVPADRRRPRRSRARRAIEAPSSTGAGVDVAP